MITDAHQAHGLPELMALSAIAHVGHRDHDRVQEVLLRTLASLDADRATH